MQPDRQPENDVDERKRRVRQVVMDCLHRRNQGAIVSDDRLIAEHADLMPELGEDLRLLGLLRSYRSDSRDDWQERSNSENLSSPTASRGLHIRCPHCHQPVEVLVEIPFAEITCRECGSHFSLVGDNRQTNSDEPLKTLGHLELIERLGVGGFGTVWKARDTQLDRTVAVKIPRQEQLGLHETEQFLREARAAAQLRHPNIVRVHEIGRHNGQLYIVSDYIRGVTMADRFRDTAATVHEAAELCAKIAVSMHHAHQAGVIHRDLKPANIMLDDDGEPHVMDFGLAKRDAGEVTMTVDGKLVGTPAYMSPEQAVGEAHQADCRSDIYSLGAILFELLTGELPFRGNSRMLIQQVIHDDPPSPRQLNSRIPRDLETICLKCLGKAPGRRYASAQQLSDELRRFLQGKPIQARRIPAVVRGWRWCRRNPMTATALALLLLLAVAGPMIAVREASLRQKADMLAEKELTARTETYRRLYIANMRLANQAWERGDVKLLAKLLRRHQYPSSGQQDLRGFEWYYLAGRLQDANETPTLLHDLAVRSVAYSTDGSTIAVATGNTVRLWDADTLERQRELRLGQEEDVVCVAFSPQDNELLALAAGNKVLLWSIATESEPMTLGAMPAVVTCLAFSPHGDLLASGADCQTVKVWNIDTGEVQHRFELSGERELSVRAMRFSPNGKSLATANYGETISLFDVATRKATTLTARTGHINDLDYSPDGTLLISVGADAAVRFWDLSRQTEVHSLVGHTAPILSMAYSPDGMTFATGAQDGTIKLWEASTKQALATLRGHTEQVLSVAYSADGSTLASASSDRTVKLWDVNRDRDPDVLVGHEGLAFVVAISPDGKTIAASGPRGVLTLWDVDTRSKLKTHGLDTRLWCVTFAPDGKTLALATNDGVKLWDVPRWREMTNGLGGPKNVICVRFSPDDRFLAAGNRQGGENVVAVWDLQTRQLISTIDGFASWYGGLTFSPDSRTLVVPRSNRTVLIWDVQARREIERLTGHDKMVLGVAFSPSGRVLASADEDTIMLWDVATWACRAEFETNQTTVECVAFSPDGTTLASSGRDGTIRLWNVTLEEEVMALRGHAGPVSGIAFSPHGPFLVSGGFDTTVRLWRASTEANLEALD